MDLSTNNRSPDKRQKLDEENPKVEEVQSSEQKTEPAQKMALDLTAHLPAAAVAVAANNESSPSINSSDSVKLGSIQFKRVLMDSAQTKMAAVEGIYKNDKAVLVFEKTPFSEENIKAILEDAIKTGKAMERDFANDVYGTYWHYTTPELNSIKTTLIHPATEKHIEKYQRQDFHILEESQETYEKVTLPYLAQSQFDISWVFNILEHKKEVERIVYEDTDTENGFVLLPDLKWDQKQNNNLYLIAIVHKRDIKSLRDLTAEHLALLNNIKTKGTQAIVDKYGISASQLRIYFHYQPSYYHLHVHFTSMAFDAPGSKVERAHLLDSVINNITLTSDYYQKATLYFSEKQGSKLYEAFLSN